MENEKKMIIHVGFARCGSTFLQKNVFPLSKKKIISNELFSGNPAYPVRFDTDFRDMMVKGLREKYGKNSNVILCIRNKDDWIKSLYNQYIRRGYFYSFDRWFNEIFDKKFLFFDEYIDDLKDNFDDVYVFDLDEFDLKKICDYIGVNVDDVKIEKVNKSINKLSLRMVRYSNFLREGFFRLNEVL